MLWIIFSLISAFLFSIRYFIVKKHLFECDAELTTFVTRLTGFVFALFMFSKGSLVWVSSYKFWIVLLITSAFTAIATVYQLKVLKKYDISYCMPFLTLIPVLMIFPVYILFNEIPDVKALWGVILISLGAFVLQKQEGFSKINLKGPLIFVSIGFVYSITTSLDRVAIHSISNGGAIYSVYFLMVSTLLMLVYGILFKKITIWKNSFSQSGIWLFFQAFAGAFGFLFQMMAVENARLIKADVILVKALVLTHILISVFLGRFLLNEKNSKHRIAGSVLMLFGALIIILYK